MLRFLRSLGVAVASMIAAVAVGLASSVAGCPQASASTAVSDTQPSPLPLISFFNPVAVGIHVVEAIAEGIANVVEMVGTPPPVTIPAPHTVKPVAGW
ncbi:hypothetical protein [Mycobacterium sp. MMS18-G62]